MFHKNHYQETVRVGLCDQKVIRYIDENFELSLVNKFFATTEFLMDFEKIKNYSFEFDLKNRQISIKEDKNLHSIQFFGQMFPKTEDIQVFYPVIVFEIFTANPLS